MNRQVIRNMKYVIQAACLFLFVGCQQTSPLSPPSQAQAEAPFSNGPQYIVLTEPPVALLNKMLILYSPDRPEWTETVDEFVASGHPVLRYAIRQLAEERIITAEQAAQINDRIDNSSGVSDDGQRALSLLETACYADVMCHGIEHPLRVATLEYIEAHVHSPGVKDALKWIRSTYHCGLPLDAPGDEKGGSRGLLVESMQIRLTEYAAQLLESEAADGK